MRRSLLGVVVLFFVACGFVMAQAAVPAGTGAVTSGNCTIEWVQVSGKANVRLTNNTDKAQTVQYTIAGKEPTTIDVPAKTVVTIPYTGASANGKFAIAKVSVVAKPKALPAGATSAAVAAPAAAPAAPAAAPKK
ncbi:MAG: hypothetical protein LBF87_03310 [Treponema sp.]|jgi:hypothetical protein|nr:hypothetical protein [Treponema sp.]